MSETGSNHSSSMAGTAANAEATMVPTSEQVAGVEIVSVTTPAEDATVPAGDELARPAPASEATSEGAVDTDTSNSSTPRRLAQWVLQHAG